VANELIADLNLSADEVYLGQGEYLIFPAKMAWNLTIAGQCLKLGLGLTL